MSDKDKLLVGDAEAEIRQLNKIADAFNNISEYVSDSNDKVINFSETIKALNTVIQAKASQYKSSFKINISNKSLKNLEAIDKAFNSISYALANSNKNMYGFSITRNSQKFI